MARVYRTDDNDARFSVKMTDCTGGDVPPKSSVAESKMVFKKPRGGIFEKDATLVDDVDNPGEYFVVYQNLPADGSIFDETDGHWEYWAKIKLIGDSTFQTSQRRIIWVE